MALSKEDRDEMRIVLRELIMEVVPDMIAATLASTSGDDDRLDADKIADVMESEFEARSRPEVNIRTALGMSPGMAQYKALLSSGTDPTPQGYDMPKRMRPSQDWEGNPTFVEVGFSYFNQNDGGPPEFRASYEALLNQGKGAEEAYEAVCDHFKVPHHKKPVVAEKYLKELPDKASPAFRLTRGEASKLREIEVGRGTPGLLGPTTMRVSEDEDEDNE